MERATERRFSVPNQSATKPIVPDFRSELDSGQWGNNSFAENRHESAHFMANGKSGVQIPAARCEFGGGIRFSRIGFKS